MRDWNAKVGSQEIPGVIGMFGLGVQNEAGQNLTVLPTSAGSQKKQENSRKTSASLNTLKPFMVYITANCGKYFKRWEYHTTLPDS